MFWKSFLKPNIKKVIWAILVFYPMRIFAAYAFMLVMLIFYIPFISTDNPSTILRNLPINLISNGRLGGPTHIFTFSHQLFFWYWLSVFFISYLVGATADRSKVFKAILILLLIFGYFIVWSYDIHFVP